MHPAESGPQPCTVSGLLTELLPQPLLCVETDICNPETQKARRRVLKARDLFNLISWGAVCILAWYELGYLITLMWLYILTLQRKGYELDACSSLMGIT